MTDKIVKNSRSLSFWGIIIVFFLPLVLAIIVYITRDHWALDSKQHGELLSPPLHISSGYDASQRLWRVLYVTPKCLGDDCELQQAKIASVRDATGKDYDRADAVFVVSSEIPEGLYIMDPDGNIILKYSLETPGAYILQDFRHLLKVSQIG